MVDVRVGDCRRILPRLPPSYFSCCVTSPPYYFVRDFGQPGQIGLEKTVTPASTDAVLAQAQTAFFKAQAKIAELEACTSRPKIEKESELAEARLKIAALEVENRELKQKLAQYEAERRVVSVRSRGRQATSGPDEPESQAKAEANRTLSHPPGGPQPRQHPEPDPSPSLTPINQGLIGVCSMKERTCEKVAELLGRLSIQGWDRDAWKDLAEEVWGTTDLNIWQDAGRVRLAEAYFGHGSGMLVFADDDEVLEFDDETGLRIVTWPDLAAKLAPHIEEDHKKTEQIRRQNESEAIVRSKLPRTRKLKAMHERIAQVLELNPTFNDQAQRGIDYILGMKTDDPDFAACVTFRDYLRHAITKVGPR